MLLKRKTIFLLIMLLVNLSYGEVKVMIGTNKSGILGSKEMPTNSYSYEFEISKKMNSKFFDKWSCGLNVSEIGMENLNCRIDKSLSNTTSYMDVYVKIRYAEIPIKFHKNVFSRSNFATSFFIGPSLFYPLKNNSNFISVTSYDEKLEGKPKYLHGDSAPLIINTEIGLNAGAEIKYSFIGFHYNYSLFLTSLNHIENFSITEKLQVLNYSLFVDIIELFKKIRKLK